MVESRQTWHPTLVRFDDGEWLCTFDIAEADVSHDYRTYGARSPTTAGRGPIPSASWPTRPAGPRRTRCASRGCPAARRARRVRRALLPRRPRGPSREPAVPRIRRHGHVHHPLPRSRPDVGGPVDRRPAARRAVVGGLPRHRRDPGRPLDGPTSTWMGWNGEAPNGMNALFLVSEDRGRTWPTYVMEFDRWAEGKIHWEQSADPAARRAPAVGCLGRRQRHGRGRRDAVRPQCGRPLVSRSGG